MNRGPHSNARALLDSTSKSRKRLSDRLAKQPYAFDCMVLGLWQLLSFDTPAYRNQRGQFPSSSLDFGDRLWRQQVEIQSIDGSASVLQDFKG